MPHRPGVCPPAYREQIVALARAGRGAPCARKQAQHTRPNGRRTSRHWNGPTRVIPMKRRRLQRVIVGRVILQMPQRRAYPVVMPTPRTDWTVDQLHELPDDGNRYEIIDGVLLVSPAPRISHQRAVRDLLVLLDAFVKQLAMEVFVAPTAVTWSSNTEVQPDVLVVPFVDGGPVPDLTHLNQLELAVEVLSPSTVRSDRFTKRREYQRRGVRVYWIVDTESRSIEVWRPGDDEPDVCFHEVVWTPIEGLAPLTIDLVSFFRRVRGE